jgi:uncharacterized integral membrane protein
MCFEESRGGLIEGVVMMIISSKVTSKASPKGGKISGKSRNNSWLSCPCFLEFTFSEIRSRNKSVLLCITPFLFLKIILLLAVVKNRNYRNSRNITLITFDKIRKYKDIKGYFFHFPSCGRVYQISFTIVWRPNNKKAIRELWTFVFILCSFILFYFLSFVQRSISLYYFMIQSFGPSSLLSLEAAIQGFLKKRP